MPGNRLGNAQKNNATANDLKLRNFFAKETSCKCINKLRPFGSPDPSAPPPR